MLVLECTELFNEVNNNNNYCLLETLILCVHGQDWVLYSYSYEIHILVPAPPTF